MNWITEGIAVLGVRFRNRDAIYTSFSKKVDKLERRISTWSSRSLSLKGKVMIINTIGLSSLTYLASILQIPSEVLKRINSIIFKFLWSTKNELVKREIIYQPCDNGGLGLVNMHNKSQALLLGSLS